MNERIRVWLLNSLLLFLIMFQVTNLTECLKKSFKDHTSNNQVETVHPVRHMARLMRRMLAEDASDGETGTTTISPSSSLENPTVTTVTSTSTTTTTSSPTFQTSTNSVPQTVSQKYRSGKTNHSLGVRVQTFDDGLFGFKCPKYLPCRALNVECIVCSFNETCVYGADVAVQCQVRDDIICQGTRTFERHMKCQYCYQTTSAEHECIQNVTCRVISSPRQRFITTCNVLPHVLCLGSREFYKNTLCNWSKGYSWATTLTLSIVLGGFGVDRFYLGMWQEGIGKLFSFGGLGVWTLVDVVLIATGYLGPADGSLYIP